jgi:hypothetical protein
MVRPMNAESLTGAKRLFSLLDLFYQKGEVIALAARWQPWASFPWDLPFSLIWRPLGAFIPGRIDGP